MLHSILDKINNGMDFETRKTTEAKVTLVTLYPDMSDRSVELESKAE